MTSIDQIIAGIDPLAGLRGATSESAEARALYEQVLTMAPSLERQVAASPRRHHRALVASSAAALLALAIGLSSLVVGNNPSAAAAEFQKLARVAAANGIATPLTLGQYEYTMSVSQGQETFAGTPQFVVNYTGHRQIWIGADGSGRIVETHSDFVFPTPTDHANWVAQGQPNLADGGTNGTNHTFGPGQLSNAPTNEWKLPTDVATLSGLISNRSIEGGPAGPAEDFVQVGDLLRETNAPAAVRSALFQVASQIPGVRLLGSLATPQGATGVGLGYAEPAQSDGRYEISELVFDPTTSQLIGEQTVMVDPSTNVTTVLYWTTYQSTGVVRSVSATP
jgi:hypothetical protein